MLRKFVASIALTIGFSASVSAAPIDVSFYIESPRTSGLVTGYLTFNDGIGDTTANILTLTSNTIGEKGRFGISTKANQFTWSESKIVDQFLLFDVFKIVADGYYTFSIGRVSDNGRIGAGVIFNCFPSCLERVDGSLVYGTLPLPAGLPLLLAGLGGLLALRLKKRIS